MGRRGVDTGGDALFTAATVNGRPALVVRDGENEAAFIVAIETGGGKIRKIWTLANPDKLRGIA